MEALTEGRGVPERPQARGKVSMGGLRWASLDLQNHFPLQPGEREDSLKGTWRWEEGQDVCSQTHMLCALPAHV